MNWDLFAAMVVSFSCLGALCGVSLLVGAWTGARAERKRLEQTREKRG